MSFRGNQPTTGRDLYFAPSGNNDLVGTSDENPLADPNEVIDRINNLDPPISSSDRASMNANIIGIYSESVTLPPFTTCNAAAASIITTDLVNITMGGNQSAEWGSLLNFAGSGTVINIDGLNRVSSITTAVVVGADTFPADDGTGYVVTGACDDVFIDLRQGELRGKRTVMIDHTAESPTPIKYSMDVVEFFNIDQIFLKYNPTGSGAAAIVEASAIQKSLPATQPVTNATIFQVMAGTLVVDASILVADTIAVVEDGGTLTLDAQAMFGDTLVKDSGIAIYKSVSIIQGNVDIEDTGTLQASVRTCIGNMTVAAGANMTITCDNFIGDLDNEGTVLAIVQNHVGEITGSGTINGLINGVPYGTYQETILLQGEDFTTQTPLGLDIPMQVTFGPAQGTASDLVMLSAAGELTANVKHRYTASFFVQYGRTGAGMFSNLFLRFLINGAPSSPINAKLDNANSDVPVQFTTILDLEIGDVVTAELIRDSGGGNSGELVTESAVLGDWTDSASAIIRISL